MKNDVTLDMSKLHRWSIGIVVKDIVIGEDIIEVYPIEKIPDENINLWMENEFKNDITNTYPKDNDTKDDEELIILKKDIAIKAMWLNDNQYNRMTPPTIRKEEYVQIYRYSNADMFFWDTLQNDVRLRKEEVIVHAYSNKPKINMDETLADMVYHKIDTLNKLIHFHTPDTNGGYTTYDITVDYGNGNITILDGKENQIKLDSAINEYSIHIEGDKNQYDSVIDGNNGFVQVIDDKGNSMKLDSAVNKYSMRIEGNINQYDNIIDGDNGFVQVIDDKGNSMKLDSVNDKYILDTNKSIITNTVNETKTITENLNINLNKVSIKNGTTELISLLSDFIQAVIEEKHIGNLGIPTILEASSIIVFTKLKTKLDTLKI